MAEEDNNETIDVSTEKNDLETPTEVTLNPDHEDSEGFEAPKEPESSTPPPQPVTPEKSKKRLAPWIIVGAVVLLGLVATAVWWFIISTQLSTPVTKTTDTEKQANTSALERFTNPQTGETWYKNWVELSDQNYFIDHDSGSDSDFKDQYYEIGKRGDNTIILVQTPGVVSYADFLFEKSPDGTITYIDYPNANIDPVDGDYAEDYGFKDTVVISRDIHYDSISIPKSISLNSDEVLTSSKYFSLGLKIGDYDVDGSVKTTVQHYGLSTLVKKETKQTEGDLITFDYSMELPTGTVVGLSFNPLQSTNDTDETTIDDYTWNDGLKRTGDITSIVRGCGAAGSMSRSDSLTDKDFVAVGNTAKKQTIYGLASKDAAIVQLAYADYTEAAKYMGDDYKTASLQEFYDDHAVLAYKDYNAEWLLFTQDKYALAGGCGKPVIYLYPTSTQVTSVKVGADVTVSDPLYNPQTGWKNIVAQPNGHLTYNGVGYDSLFWEGTGSGKYPAVTSGTVVAHSEAEATIRQQLAAQGLNQKEINDFMDFWAPRIPDAPYIRLAWFNTDELNKLAPLYISPKPQTVIRVFLDMRGLSAPLQLPAPSFNAPQRQGFTVVEWGGLL